MADNRLNIVGKKKLASRCNQIYHKGLTKFSVIFMSDTHDNNADATYRENYYKSLLKEANKGDTLCIIHGGDAGDLGKKANLQNFVKATNSVLGNSRIPLILTIGNHDYDSNMSTINNFKDLIGDKTVDTLTLRHFNTKIVQLDTDASYPGHLTNNSWNLLEKIVGDKSGTHYIIDMHVPPQIGKFAQKASHTLTVQDTKKFLNKLDKGKGVIDVVFVHHQHFYWLEHYCTNGNKTIHIPIIMTGTAGRNSDKSKNHFIKITMNKNSHQIIALKKYNLKTSSGVDVQDIMKDLKRTACATVPK